MINYPTTPEGSMEKRNGGPHKGGKLNPLHFLTLLKSRGLCRDASLPLV